TRFSRDWSSDVCSSDLAAARELLGALRRDLGEQRRSMVNEVDKLDAVGKPELDGGEPQPNLRGREEQRARDHGVTSARPGACSKIGRASCRERGRSSGA